MSKKIILHLVIGITKQSKHWHDGFITSLKSDLPDADINLLDLPGAGEFAHQKSPLSIKAIAEKTFENYREAFQTDAENILVAISLGGMVALELAKLKQSLFSGLILVNSSMKGVSPLTKRVQPHAIKEFLKIFATKDHHERERRVVELCSNNKEEYDHTIKKWVEIARTENMSQGNVVRQAVAGATFSPSDFPQIPHLILASRYDRLAHYTCSEKINELWPGDIEIFDKPHIGHAFHIDDPKILSGSIAQWWHNSRQ